jgi:hypothetical protein
VLQACTARRMCWRELLCLGLPLRRCSGAGGTRARRGRWRFAVRAAAARAAALQCPTPPAPARRSQDLYVAVTKATLADEVVPKEKHVRSAWPAGSSEGHALRETARAGRRNPRALQACRDRAGWRDCSSRARQAAWVVQQWASWPRLAVPTQCAALQQADPAPACAHCLTALCPAPRAVSVRPPQP